MHKVSGAAVTVVHRRRALFHLSWGVRRLSACSRRPSYELDEDCRVAGWCFRIGGVVGLSPISTDQASQPSSARSEASVHHLLFHAASSTACAPDSSSEQGTLKSPRESELISLTVIAIKHVVDNHSGGIESQHNRLECAKQRSSSVAAPADRHSTLPGRARVPPAQPSAKSGFVADSPQRRRGALVLAVPLSFFFPARAIFASLREAAIGRLQISAAPFLDRLHQRERRVTHVLLEVDVAVEVVMRGGIGREVSDVRRPGLGGLTESDRCPAASRQDAAQVLGAGGVAMHHYRDTRPREGADRPSRRFELLSFSGSLPSVEVNLRIAASAQQAIDHQLERGGRLVPVDRADDHHAVRLDPFRINLGHSVAGLADA